MKREDFPSVKKYRKNHPSVTFRLKREEKENLDKILKATGMSLSTWMSSFVTDHLPIYAEGPILQKKIAALETRNKELAAERRFSVRCSVCGKSIFFSSKNANWKSEVYPELQRVFCDWSHGDCQSS